MTPIGNRIGTSLTKMPQPAADSGWSVWCWALPSPLPSLTCRCWPETVPHINNTVLLVTVGAGRRHFSGSVHAAHPPGHLACGGCCCCSTRVVFVLAALADPDFLVRCVRLRRRDHRAHDRALHSGAGRGRFQHPKRQKGRGGQLRSGGAVLHRPDSGGAGAGLLLFQPGNRRRKPACVILCKHHGHRQGLPGRAFPSI